MKNIQLEKNVLDLEYQKNLQYLNAILIIGAGSLIAYISSLILNFDKWLSYTIIIFFMGCLTSWSLILVNKKLQKISLEIKNLNIIRYINK